MPPRTLPLAEAGFSALGRGRDTNAVAAAEPSDEEIVARLRSAGPAEVAALRAALDEVRRAAASGPLATWPDPRGDGSEENPLHMPYPEYHPSVLALTSALVAVNAMPVFSRTSAVARHVVWSLVVPLTSHFGVAPALAPSTAFRNLK